MITNRIIPEDAVLVAIDIAKARNDVLIEVRGNKRRKRPVVLNTRAEHDRFIDMLTSFDRDHKWNIPTLNGPKIGGQVNEYGRS